MGTLAPLDDPRNRLVRLVRRVRDGDRPAQGRPRLFLEGLRLVEEAVASGQELEVVLYSPRLLTRPGGPELLAAVTGGRTRVLYVTDRLLESVADTKTPQGIVAVARALRVTVEDVCLHPCPLVVVARGVQDPGNLGTIIRTADAAGASGVLCTPGTVAVANPKVIRGSMGSIFHLPVVEVGAEDWRGVLRQFGLRLLALDPRGERLPYELDLTAPVAILVGNEAWGVAEEDRWLADELVRLPMPGRAESLNAAVAAAVLLYEAVRQRLMRGKA